MTTCSFCGRPGVYVAAESDAGGILSRTHSDATPCPGPGARVTEAELLRWESAYMREDGSVPEFNHSTTETLRAVNAAAAEIRRYRALLLGLKDPRVLVPTKGILMCAFCGESQHALGALAGDYTDEIKHADDCPWPELEAEVKAIRAERQKA